MQRKLLRIAGFYGVLFATFGAFIAGCVDEPTIPKVERMYTSTRFVNVCVDQPAIDIWIDSLRYGNIPYKGHLDYTDIPSGTRFFRVTAVGGDTSEALLRGEVFFRSLTQTTVIVYGRSEVISSTDFGRIGVTFTQERFTYSDETSKLPLDSGKIKLVNCIVSNNPDLKFAAGLGLSLRDTMMVDGVPVATIRISGIQAPPTTANDPPNLSAYIKYPVGQRSLGAWAGSFPIMPNTKTALQPPWNETIERRYYTYIATGLMSDLSTFDVLRLTDR